MSRFVHGIGDAARSRKAVNLDDATRRIWGQPLGLKWADADFAVRAALADGGLDRPAGFSRPDGQTPSLCRPLIDLVNSARHAGRADLLCEAIDGPVGEDAPGSW